MVEVLLDGDMGDVLDLYGIEAGVGEQPGESGIETALQIGEAVALLTGGTGRGRLRRRLRLLRR